MRLFAVLFVLVAGISFAFTNDQTNTGEEPSFIEYYKVGEPANVTISTSGGWIKAMEGNAGSVTVEFYVYKSGKRQDMTLDELKEKMDVEIENEGNNLSIQVKSKDKSLGWMKKLSVSFVVHTPQRSNCILKTSGGKLKMAGLTGSQVLSTSGGSIVIGDLEGDVAASTSGGSIKAADIEGNLTAKTSGGHIELEDIEGNVVGKTSGGHINAEDIEGNVVLGTSGGHINLSDIEGQTVAKTSGGHISINDVSGAIEAKTSGGGIKGNMPEVSGPVDLATSGGSIVLDVPDNLGMDVELKGNSTNIECGSFKGTSKRNYKQGTVNGGGVSIRLKTSAGSATLK